MHRTSEPRAGEQPLSFGQQSIWLLDQLHPGTPYHTLVIRIHIAGPLRPQVLEESLRALVRRHDVLRATYVTVEGRPVQRILETQPCELQRDDLTGVGAADLGGRIDALAAAAVEEPFDLSTGPLLRCRLVALAAREHLLLLTVHHIAFDGGSVRVLMQEAATIYDALANGRAPQLDPLPWQYADFARAQRERLRDDVVAPALAYWRARLAGSRGPDLRTDRPRRGSPLRTRSVATTVSSDLVEQLRALAHRHSATLFMTLMSAFKLLLMRHTGQEDIVVGFPMADRTAVETRGLIGFFVNTVLLRTDLSGDPAFTALLARERDGALAAYRHAAVPYERVVQELEPERRGTSSPLVNVWLVVERPVPPVEIGDLRLSYVELQDAVSKFDLLLRAAEGPAGLAMTWMFNEDLFDVAALEVMAKRFEQILRSIVTHPEARLSAVEIRTAEERERISSDAAARREQRQRARAERLRRIRGTAPELAEDAAARASLPTDDVELGVGGDGRPTDTERPWTT